MKEEKTVPKVSSCKALEGKEHCGDWKHGFIESKMFIEKKGKNRALCAESARLASIQRAVRTIDGHKARSPRILFVLLRDPSEYNGEGRGKCLMPGTLKQRLSKR